MSKLKDSEDVDDGDSWRKLKKEIEAVTDNESEQLSKLTEIVLVGFVNGLVKELTMKKKKKMIVEKKGIKRRPGSQTYCVKDDKEENLIMKQENIIQKKGIKHCAGTATQTSDDEGEKEEHMMRKPKKQKTSGNEKKTNQKKRFDAITELVALGLEPPPDMPEAFKNRIENLGGTDVKLVIQKIIFVTDLRKSQNRLSMPINQIRNKFLSEAEEEEKFKNNGGMDVILVEPCLEVSKLHLTKWLIGGSFTYVFKTQWNKVVKNNADSLKPMAVVQIWSFRVGPESQLGFAMIKVKDGEDGHQID